MSQPVKLSDTLVLKARLRGRAMERSIARQVEFWASLGEAIEPLLDGARMVALRQKAATKPVSECLKPMEAAESRRLVADYLKTQPYPHFEPHPDHARWFIRTDADGKRIVGRFVRGVFKPIRTRAGRT